jgi:hypothetical protein
MKKKMLTFNKTRKLIKDKVSSGMDIVKAETSVIIGKAKKVASATNRKGKAAFRAIRS